MQYYTIQNRDSGWEFTFAAQTISHGPPPNAKMNLCPGGFVGI